MFFPINNTNESKFLGEEASISYYELKIQKVKIFFTTSSLFQKILGIGIGINLPKITVPLTNRVLKALGSSLRCSAKASLGNIPFLSKIIIFSFVCILAPLTEEILFREVVQEKIKNTLNSFYINLDFSDTTAKMAARITSIFFTSVVFGVYHFTNALFFWCHPILFLPQAIAATIVGLGCGIAKEVTGELNMPIAMHMGNNVFVMA